MRVSDNRYMRDHARLDLAMRFMRHEARTQTIRKWTGFTDNRIRKLYKTYLAGEPARVPRHRGKSPGQPSFFTRTPRVQSEAAVLASLFSVFGLTPVHGAVNMDQPAQSVELGERLCHAFESYLKTFPVAQITFEHAVLLLKELTRGVELRLEECNACCRLVVVDPLTLRDEATCGHCG